jgi:hypothetical protein
MTDKQAMQADGSDAASKKPDGVETPHGRSGGGESGGGAYPNPHAGKHNKEDPGDFLGTGGQTEQAYHGPGQLGDKTTGKDGNRTGQGG